MPDPIPISSSEGAREKRLPSSVDEFVAEENLQKFVQIAYRVILGREADPVGAVGYINHLKERRLTKREMLVILHLSEEGKKNRPRVAGLSALVLAHQFRARLRKKRMGAALLRWWDAAWRGRFRPDSGSEVEYSCRDPLSSEGEGLTREDVIAAFHLAFHRDPESEEAIAHQLLSHSSLDSLMTDFFRSPEFLRKNLTVIEILSKKSCEQAVETTRERSK